MHRVGEKEQPPMGISAHRSDTPNNQPIAEKGQSALFGLGFTL